MKNRIFLFALLLVALSTVIFAVNAFAATTCQDYYKLVGENCVPMTSAEICPMPHSYQSSTPGKCQCEKYYKAENGQCVPMAESEICPFAGTHRVGDKCLCDAGYKFENNACVQMTEAEICPIAHSSLSSVDGKCHCDYSYKAENDICVPMTEADICPMPHTHLVGDNKCFCDDGYQIKGDACVPIPTPEKSCSSTPNSHRDGDYCVCDTGYTTKNGACVPVSTFEACGTENAHIVGDKCLCDKGYGMINGKCVSKSSYCTSHNAHYNASIDDCDCNEGYIENEAGNDCSLIPVKSTPPVEPPPTNVTTEQEDTPSPDLIDVMITLKDDPNAKFSVQPLIDASLKNATKAEIQTVTKQKESIESYSEAESTEVELSLTTGQKMDLAKEIIKENVEKDLNKWQIKVDIAEETGNVKDKKDKEKFEQLKKQEESLMQQIKDNEDALDVMHRQNLALMKSTKDYAPGLLLDAKQQNMSKRDFMADAHGDQGEALIYASQAISAQYELLGKLEDKLRTIKDQKRNLLDIPPKPDLEKELAKININWYR